MYKLDIRVDTKESAAIARRRSLERERQSRIFNARERTIGVDVGALGAQVEERRWHEETEKKRHEAFAAEMTRNAKIGELLQQRQERDIGELNKSLVAYQKEHQRVQDRHEFDLYDPESKRKDLPARVSDEDSRLSVSGLQCLDGEDLSYEQRKKLQQEQMREWTSQQMRERERLAGEERRAERLHQLKACELDQRAVELDQAQQSTRTAINAATRDYNLALAREKAARQQELAAQDQDDSHTELCNHVHGDLLTENPEVAASAFGSHRVIPDRWKGMSPQQVSEVRAIQKLQKEDKLTLEAEERHREREWDRRRVSEAKAAMVLEKQLDRKRKDLVKKQAEENRQLAAEQRARQDDLSKSVYTNPPSEGYFAQFNTSSR